MIQLTKLRLKNFKSFRNATIPLTDGFTAIAGANGSGKSNIMDAVLFALGEPSLNSLRASRLTELVHTGAADGEKYAIVTLSFQTEKGAYDISRMVDKQGKSVYRINEKRVTMGEVQNLMAELGMRVDGHNLVSQGDLLRIIDMNPVERRQLIDEIAGLQEFEEKKNEALKDLEKVDRRIKDITIVLNERMAVIEQLGRERDVAKRFTHLEKELRQTKATILHLESTDLNQKLEKIVQGQMEIIEKKDDAQKKQIESLTDVKKLEQEFYELDAKVLGIRGESFKDSQPLESIKADIRVNEEQQSHFERQIADLHKQKTEWQLDLNEWQKIQDQHPELETERKKVQEELQKTDEELTHHAGMHFSLADSLKQLGKVDSKCPICDRELAKKVKEKMVSEKESALKIAQKHVNELREKRNTLRGKWEELQSSALLLHRLAKSGERVHVLNAEEKKIEKSIREVNEAHKALEKKRGEAEKKHAQFVHTNQELLQKREKVQQKLGIERERERAWQDKTYRLEGQLSELKIEQSKYDTRLLDVKEEMKNFEGVTTFDGKDIVEYRKHVPQLEHDIRQLGTINMKALEDFGQYEKDVLDIRQKAQTLDEERLAVMDLISSIDVKRNEVFMKTFNAINENFNKLYTGFFDGTALLGLTNPAKPLESGLIIEAKHGLDKVMKKIDSMSGGEKSLTSLAFIFAIQLYEPAPFYFFDEVDAALDMTNSRKVGLLIKDMSKRSQFISITHNDQVVKVADQIVGVAKNHTNSSVIGLRPGMGKESIDSPSRGESISS
ncbi:MAG: chromosome segregation SMC family protein [archaeon]